MMNGKYLEGSDCGVILRNYFSIRLEGLRKTTNDLSQDSQSLDGDLKSTSRIRSRSEGVVRTVMNILVP
jgi:hypothetical protein